MADQPEALRLASECDTGHPLEEGAKQAAAELRRLHFMLEAAREVGIEQEIERMLLEFSNQKLLQAIYEAQRQLINLLPIIANGLLTDRQLAAIDPHIDMALQALASAEGEKT
jgi:hypothetical protein